MAPQANSEAFFGPHREAMTRALESKTGVAVKLANKKAAINFRHQCHTLRARQRSKLAREVGPDFAHLVTTEFDPLTFQIKNDCEVHITRITIPEIVPL